MIFMDPPDHTQLRAARVARVHASTGHAAGGRASASCAHELLDAQLGAGGRSTTSRTSRPASRPKVIAALLGVPDADREHVREHIDPVFHIEPGVGMINDVSLDARHRAQRLPVRAARTTGAQHPRDDMLTDLVQRRDHRRRRHGSGSSPQGESADVRQPAHQRGHRDRRPPARLGGGRARRAPRPAGGARRRRDAAPQRGRGAAALRSAVAGAGPLDHRDVELHGEIVPANSKVLLLTGAAGRDERKYPDADRFDIHRPIDHHVVVRLRHPLLPRRRAGPPRRPHRASRRRSRYPAWDVDQDRAVRLHTSTVRGYSRLPIAVPAR